MAKTGKQFDMDPKTFTLANLFAMQLHTMAADIGEITSAAIKELTIEKEIEKMAAVWAEQRFELFKYMKGSEDRGWILRSTEEVTVLLEDMGLNLQSMMASRFVKPFMDGEAYDCYGGVDADDCLAELSTQLGSIFGVGLLVNNITEVGVPAAKNWYARRSGQRVKVLDRPDAEDRHRDGDAEEGGDAQEG